ncbi:EAL domain-containing protein [Pseudoalteromonas xiamenensis]|uniref:bifunctional diguanylate cyclase/phosphodiesterase n=1 Tax=Pseudoalteromonas xiamenensis TaxID=882626 RepID=UPI0027E5917B|nr:EAL domain-containing protein [Pseudoalteromonas xiamenensis]WMN60409.1 EAL domain-containing protein [Pseudoalteromonas xiamenensis]
MGNRRPPSRFAANSLSMKLTLLISAICLFAGLCAAAFMLKSEEKLIVFEEFKLLKRSSAQIVDQFQYYLQSKTNVAEQANAVVTKQLFSDSSNLANHSVYILSNTPEGKISTSQNGLSAAFVPRDVPIEDDHLLTQSESLWNVLAPTLLQDFANFYLYTEDGFSRVAPPNILLQGGQQHRFLQHQDLNIIKDIANPTREAVWSDVHFDEIWKKWVVSILVPIYLQNEFVGMTGADIALDQLLKHLPLSGNDYGLVIFDNKGKVLASPELHKSLTDTSLMTQRKLPAELQALVMETVEKPLMEREANFSAGDEEYIINIRMLKQLNWFVGIYKKRSAVLASLDVIKYKFFGLFILYAFFVAMLLHQTLYQLVLGRINALVDAISGFGKGQFQVLNNLPTNDDEIGMLNESIKDMATEIGKLIDGLNVRIVEKEDAEKEANRFLKAVAASGTGVVLTDAHFDINYVNPKMMEMTGFEAEHFLGSPLLTIISREMAILVDDIDIDLRSRNSWRGDTVLQGKDNKPVWVSLSVSPIREDGGKITSYVASAQDISFVKESQRKMEELAYFDTLTGLANRTFFRMQLRKSMALAQRGHYAFALFYFDLDEFKRINDTLGHDAGDRLLIEVADRLKRRLRAEDTIARLGGDEFAVLLSGIEQRDHAMDVAHTIQQTLSKPIMLGNNEVIVSASIGITMAPFDSQEEEQLLKHADLAMYEAKAKGKNTFHFYSKELDAAANERLYIENELRIGIKEKQFHLHYQPQVDCRTNRIVGYEALIRWTHPDEGNIPPVKFIPIAEATGLIVEIGAWVLEEACQFANRMLKLGRAANISINLSARQFKDAQLIETLADILKRTQLPAEYLHLELTESMLMGDVKAAINQLHQIKELGVALSIDDFGTGYSSLSYLKRFPVDILKVDRSFVKDIPEDLNDMEITAAIIAMAQKLNLKVVAEGVETKAQMEFLQRNNCYIVQGYYYSAPVAEQDLSLVEDKLAGD